MTWQVPPSVCRTTALVPPTSRGPPADKCTSCAPPPLLTNERPNLVGPTQNEISEDNAECPRDLPHRSARQPLTLSDKIADQSTYGRAGTQVDCSKVSDRGAHLRKAPVPR